MRKLRISIRVAGAVTAFFTVFHLMFYWLFNWKQALQCLDKDTWAIFHCFNICMDTMFLLFSFISFRYTAKLIEETLGRVWLLFMALIYVIRIICEFILWDFNPIQSVIIVILCLIPAVGYLYPLMFKK
jgi:hypothetical protein